jgi:hypothetical protein
VANSNKRNNSIESLLINDVVSSDHTKIKDHIVHFYDSMFIEDFSWQPKLDYLSFDYIGQDAAC